MEIMTWLTNLKSKPDSPCPDEHLSSALFMTLPTTIDTMTHSDRSPDQIFNDIVNRAECERGEHLRRGVNTPSLEHFVEMEAVEVDDIDMKRHIYMYADTPSSNFKLGQSFEAEYAPSVALKYYQRAAEMGSGDACLRLGELYRDSENHKLEPVNQSPDETVAWFKRAAEHGREEKAFLELGKIADHGIRLNKKDTRSGDKYVGVGGFAYPLSAGIHIDFPDNTQAINYLEHAGVEGRNLLSSRFADWACYMERLSIQNGVEDPRAQEYAIKSLEYGAGSTNRLILAGRSEFEHGECARIALGIPPPKYVDSATQRSEWYRYVAQCYEEGVGVAQDKDLSRNYFRESKRELDKVVMTAQDKDSVRETYFATAGAEGVNIEEVAPHMIAAAESAPLGVTPSVSSKPSIKRSKTRFSMER